MKKESWWSSLLFFIPKLTVFKNLWTELIKNKYTLFTLVSKESKIMLFSSKIVSTKFSKKIIFARAWKTREVSLKKTARNDNNERGKRLNQSPICNPGCKLAKSLNERFHSKQETSKIIFQWSNYSRHPWLIHSNNRKHIYAIREFWNCQLWPKYFGLKGHQFKMSFLSSAQKERTTREILSNLKSALA